MFYSIFHMPQPNFSLRDSRRIKILGYLVKMGKRFLTVQPSTNPVTKDGHKQFWFYYEHKSILAIQKKDGCWYAKNH